MQVALRPLRQLIFGVELIGKLVMHLEQLLLSLGQADELRLAPTLMLRRRLDGRPRLAHVKLGLMNLLRHLWILD